MGLVHGTLGRKTGSDDASEQQEARMTCFNS